eukprot:EG_transcript_1799
MNGTAEGPGQVFYGVWFGQDDPRNSIVLMQDRAQTENRALLRAALLALQMAPRERPLEIRTTAEYLPRTVYGGPLARWRQSKWTAPDIKNRQLWQQVDEAMGRRGQRVVWKHASAAEQEAIRNAFVAHLHGQTTAVPITLSVMLPTLGPRPVFYGCWFGRGDPRNARLVLQDEAQTEARAALRAALLALQRVATDGLGPAVEIRTRSNYLLQAVRLLPKWHARGWVASDGQPVSNADLWQEVWAVLQRLPGRQVSWQYLWQSAESSVQAELFPITFLSEAATPPVEATPSVSQPVVVYTSVAWPRGKGSPAVYGLWFGPDDARNQARWTNNVVQSQNKAELEAVIAALSLMVLGGVKEVEVRTHSIYIVQNVQKLDEWRDNQWRKRRGEMVSHLEEWKQLDNFIRSTLLRVSVRFVELPEQKDAVADLTQRAGQMLPPAAPPAPFSLVNKLDLMPLAPAGTVVAYTGVVWPWGWGAVPVYGVWFGEQDPRNVVEAEHGEVAPYQSQNRAELRAVVRAIAAAQRAGTDAKRLELRTHCHYLVSAFQQLKAWKANRWSLHDGSEVPNRDLWETVDRSISQSGMRLAFRFVPRNIYTPAQAELAARAAAVPHPAAPPTAASGAVANSAAISIAALVDAAVREPALASQLADSPPPAVVAAAVRAAMPTLLAQAGVPTDLQAEVAEELLTPGQAVEALWAAAKTAAVLHNPAPGEVEKAVLSVLDGAVRFAHDQVKSDGALLK